MISVSLDKKEKKGKVCGKSFIPKSYTCRDKEKKVKLLSRTQPSRLPTEKSGPSQERNTSTPSQHEQQRRAAIAAAVGIAGLSTAAYLGNNPLVNEIKDASVMVASGLAFQGLNEARLGGQIEKLPLPDETKRQVKGLVGTAKVYAMNTVLESSGAELQSVNPEKNYSTWKKGDSYYSVGSVGSNVLTFSTEKKEGGADNLYEMSTRTNKAFDQEPMSNRDGLRMVSMARSIFKEHMGQLPDESIVQATPYVGDANWLKRRTIFEREGFRSNIKFGPILWTRVRGGKSQRIPNNEIQSVANQVLGKKKEDHFALDSKKEQRELGRTISKLIERASGKKVRGIRIQDIKKGRDGKLSFSGSYDTGGKRGLFKLSDKRLSFKEDASFVFLVPLLDAEKKCSKGKVCGNTCIPKNSFCHTDPRSVSSSRDRSRIQELGSSLLSGGKERRTRQKPEDDGLDGLSIRELKTVAQSEEIVGRGTLNTKEQFRQAIRAGRLEPDTQKVIRKTAEQKRLVRRAANKTRIGRLARDWNKLQRVASAAGLGSLATAGFAGAWLLGESRKEYNEARSNYRKGLNNSAQDALRRAEKAKAEGVRQQNITFAVGGTAAENSSGEKIRDLLVNSSEADQPGVTPEEKNWFRDKHKIIPFNLEDSEIPPYEGTKKNSDGSLTPGYLGYLAKGSAQNYLANAQIGVRGALSNLIGVDEGGRNQDAVELASQIYAYSRYKSEKGRLSNKNKPINIIAHGAGGNVAREAVDILSRMPNGREVLQNVSVTGLSVGDFGFSTPDLAGGGDISLTTSSDPISQTLPQRNPRSVNSVRGREPEDFLRDQAALSEIRRHMGFAQSSRFQREATEKRRRERAASQRRKKSPPKKRNNTGNDKETLIQTAISLGLNEQAARNMGAEALNREIGKRRGASDDVPPKDGGAR